MFFLLFFISFQAACTNPYSDDPHKPHKILSKKKEPEQILVQSEQIFMEIAMMDKNFLNVPKRTSFLIPKNHLQIVQEKLKGQERRRSSIFKHCFPGIQIVNSDLSYQAFEKVKCILNSSSSSGSSSEKKYDAEEDVQNTLSDEKLPWINPSFPSKLFQKNVFNNEKAVFQKKAVKGGQRKITISEIV